MMMMTMSGGRFLQHLLPAVLILFLFQQRVADSDVISCREEEREALIVFKQGLLDNVGILSSWGSEDDKKNCCAWEGIQCLQTGHVYGLALNGKNTSNAPFEGTINASLLKLPHLSYLDLSYNNFSWSPIPEFIDSLTQLRHLDLSHADLKGPIPHRLGNLSRLQLLDLSGNDGLYNVGNIEWLSHLSSLRYLDLSGSDLRKSNDWFQAINKLPFLTDLRVVWCNLPQIMPWAPLKVNATASFVSLDLTGNNVTNSIYPWLFNVSSNLNRLSLNFNLLQGSIPEAFGNYMVSLTDLFLQSNELEGGFPKSIGNMSCLHTLELSSNNLIGQLSGFFQNLSGGCTEKKLEFLYLLDNKITGSVPDFTRFSSLKELGLGQNRLNGTIHKSIGQMFELRSLDLGDNSLEGVISEDFFLNLSKLVHLDLSRNSLVLEISDDWVPDHFPPIGFLYLASCKMGPHFPKWLRKLQAYDIYLGVLDISNAGISDTVPEWIWDLFSSIHYFNVSYNQIKGNLPDFSLLGPSVYLQLDMSSNYLEGPILSLPEGSYINLSGNKFSGSSSFICSNSVKHWNYLDLSNNLLSGMLPDCWIELEELVVLNLANNGFSGKIPPSMGSLHNIQTLRLSNNNFFGELPNLSNCTQLKILDLQDNALSGKIPEWIGESLPSLLVLSLESNRFNGNIPFQLCRLANIQILDLSLNNISGSIPKCFNNFTALSKERSSQAAITHLFESYSLDEAHLRSAFCTSPSIANSLGMVEEDERDNKISYYRGGYCLDNLKDLLRFLKREDLQTREVFKQVSYVWLKSERCYELLRDHKKKICKENYQMILMMKPYALFSSVKAMMVAAGCLVRDCKETLSDDSDDETLSSVFKKSRKLHSKAKDDRLETIQVEKTNEDAGNGGTTDAKGSDDVAAGEILSSAFSTALYPTNGCCVTNFTFTGRFFQLVALVAVILIVLEQRMAAWWMNLAVSLLGESQDDRKACCEWRRVDSISPLT
ncbi:hypothetical protein Pint_17595 [Pistacia integerrima]|uniref:Uncharacterized protein n=1 Tax=Pistacia integerrima TaxID=434235 RepID=A0ACC0YX15_9ROSI|nr:hypothetical protein Pint_17595 [Pistacia integerrima]